MLTVRNFLKTSSAACSACSIIQYLYITVLALGTSTFILDKLIFDLSLTFVQLFPLL